MATALSAGNPIKQLEQRLTQLANAVHRADVGDFQRIEFRALDVQQRHHGNKPMAGTDHRAVPRRRVIERVDGVEAAGAGLILRNDRGCAWDMPWNVARKQTRVDVIGFTRAQADDEADLLAFIEVGDNFRWSLGIGCARPYEHGARQKHSHSQFHGQIHSPLFRAVFTPRREHSACSFIYSPAWTKARARATTGAGAL